MRNSAAVLVSFGVAICGAAATAQVPPAAPAATRTVIAATKLVSVVDKPLFFRALSITIPPGKKNDVLMADGVLYQVSGSTEIGAGGKLKTLAPGEGTFIAAGQSSLTAKGSEPSTSIHFLLGPALVYAEPAAAKELYRTGGPIPNLKSGTYDLNLTRVTFPAHMPSNAPHHRSGAALYYVLSGTGANTVNGKVEERRPGSVIYEPSTLVHQWGNPGDEALTFLTFNINQGGVPAVIAEKPARSP